MKGSVGSGFDSAPWEGKQHRKVEEKHHNKMVAYSHHLTLDTILLVPPGSKIWPSRSRGRADPVSTPKLAGIVRILDLIRLSS